MTNRSLETARVSGSTRTKWTRRSTPADYYRDEWPDGKKTDARYIISGILKGRLKALLVGA